MHGTYLKAGNPSSESRSILSHCDFSKPQSIQWDEFNQHQLVVGHQSGEEASVFVIETLNNVRRAIRRKVLVQLAVLGILGLVAAGIVNFVLLKIVGRPLSQLLKTVENITSGQLGAVAPSFSSSEMNQLSTAINSMSMSLNENDRDRRYQMEKARKIQQYLLPHGVHIPGLETAHIFEPADSVAGDYYDFLPLSDGSWLICIADVSGHGVPAAMGAAMLKALLLAASEKSPFDLIRIMKEVNRQFAATILPGNFASMFLARWKPELRALSWVSAGHLPGILIRDSGSLDSLKSTGLLVGLDANTDWEQVDTVLSPGDRILLFSDGVTETANSQGGLFGLARLTSWFSIVNERPLSVAIMKINEVIAEWRCNSSPNDDLTLLALKCESAPYLKKSEDQASTVYEEVQTFSL
tara:strand:- start:246 stop:1478 length:1233 start_codon:yes stop_codon:yes gene_type:complete